MKSEEEKIDTIERDLTNSDKPKYIADKAKFNLEENSILSEATRIQIAECITKLKYHKKIYEEWNFSSVDPMGRSSILNFYGPPGTGKTLTAQAFAGSLGLPIIQVGVSEIESKFLGETSKNIQEVFRSAVVQGAILFFDEADTLLGKRLSSVTQGVDNEINSMRSTMLIELEKFEGIAIFATNFGKNYDSAFKSRINYHIEFELPDLNARRMLWDKFVVQGIPIFGNRTEMIESISLVSDGMSGREIRTAMRLALPKAIVEFENDLSNARLRAEHILMAINSIKQSRNDLLNSSAENSNQSISTATKLLGIK